MTNDLGGIISLSIGIITLAGTLVTLGRVLERQWIHGETIRAHDARLDELEKEQGEHSTLFADLRGQINGLRESIDTVSHTLGKWIDRMDRVLDRTAEK